MILKFLTIVHYLRLIRARLSVKYLCFVCIFSVVVFSYYYGPTSRFVRTCQGPMGLPWLLLVLHWLYTESQMLIL